MTLCCMCLAFRALRTCEDCLSIYPLKEKDATGKVDKESFGWVVYSCILAILRVLLNLTHDNGKFYTTLSIKYIVLSVGFDNYLKFEYLSISML